MKSSGAYYILREFHRWVGENDSGIQLPLENAIQILIGDEPEEGKENIREVKIPEHIQKHFNESDQNVAPWRKSSMTVVLTECTKCSSNFGDWFEKLLN